MAPSPSTPRPGRRPATGRSFVIVLVIGGLAALIVTIWTFHAIDKTPRRDGAAAASFKI